MAVKIEKAVDRVVAVTVKMEKEGKVVTVEIEMAWAERRQCHSRWRTGRWWWLSKRRQQQGREKQWLKGPYLSYGGIYQCC